MRILTVFCVLWWMPSFHSTGFSIEKSPEGIARLFSTVWLADHRWFQLVLLGVSTGAVLYLGAGLWNLRARRSPDFATPLGLTMMFAGITLIQSNRNSQDATHHGYQALALVLLAQALVFWLAWWRDRRHPAIARGPATPGLTWEDWGVYFSVQTLAACYFVAACSKLRASGLRWAIDSPMIVTSMMRTGDEYYYDTLDPTRLGSLDPWIHWFLAHPTLVRIGMGGTLLIELLAVFALLGPLWALAIGALVELLHWGIGETMHLYFRVNQILVLAFLINLPRWLVAGRRWALDRVKAVEAAQPLAASRIPDPSSTHDQRR